MPHSVIKDALKIITFENFDIVLINLRYNCTILYLPVL